MSTRSRNANAAPASGRRKMRSREPIAMIPILVSDLTCLVVTGMTKRQFREQMARAGLGKRVGKRLIVDAADLRVWLRSVDSSSVAAERCDDELEQLDGADAVLAALGMREVSG